VRKRKIAQKKQRVSSIKRAGKKKTARRKPRLRIMEPAVDIALVETLGLGPDIAGRSGDREDLWNVAVGNSHTVTELVKAGRDPEAEVVGGVESAPEPDQGEVIAHERRQQFAPREYEELP
jgi:hypothetical protein